MLEEALGAKKTHINFLKSKNKTTSYRNSTRQLFVGYDTAKDFVGHMS